MSHSYGALRPSPDSELGGYEILEDITSDTTNSPDYTQKKSGNWTAAITTTVALTVAAASVILLAASTQTFKSNTQTIFESTSESLSLSAISNAYGLWSQNQMLPYTFLIDSFLIEPYKETSISIADPNADCSYNWSFTSKTTGDVASSGSTSDGNFVVTLKTVSEYQMDISELCGGSNVAERTLSNPIWVKYVRRELSTLTDNDRETFLDAFHTLWTVSTTKGKLLYGEKYKSVNYFATLHNDGGGNAACDEFHGGLGFLNNHMYLSAYLEQSLQLVNPATALHYMEYSKYFDSAAFQGHLHTLLDGGSWTELLTAKFFGTSDPLTGRIMNGRWENATVPYVTGAFFIEEGITGNHTFFPTEEKEWLTRSEPHMSNPYGLLRSPWNFNPSPLVTRYGSVFGIEDYTDYGVNKDAVYKMHMGVVCDDYTKFFEMNNGKSFETFLLAIENDTHGIFHFTFGGVGGKMAAAAVKKLMNDFGFSVSNIGTLASTAQPFFKKNLALSHEYPVNCTATSWNGNLLVNSDAAPGEALGPSCDFSDEFYESEDALSGLIDWFFQFDLDRDDHVATRLADMSFDDRKEAMRTIGGMFPYDGDLAGSGAALDPLFWVAHGALERMFQKAIFSGMFEETVYDSVSHCSGHNAIEKKAWLDGYHFIDQSIITSDLTNSELTVILDPKSNEYRDLINFVYDVAEFEWCEDASQWFPESA